MQEANFLIIGSGIAGLTFAVKISEKFPDKTIVIVTKSDEEESNTKYAQGGIAVVLDSKIDTFKKHIQDTLLAGDGLCDEAVVEMVIKEGPKRIEELMLLGTNFDTNSSGKLDVGKEGGHSENRVIHHKDITGFEIERALLKRINQLTNISVLQHHFAIDLITEHHINKLSTKNITCYGAYVLNQNEGNVLTIKADSTIVASGGIGRVYGHTTNPIIATGDGIAMAYRSKAQIKDMEFVQFHPTALFDIDGGSAFLISEAVRGFGAYLRTKDGHRFMPDYNEKAELASRDIVSQCIDLELKISGDSCVYLDCTHLNIETFIKHFPNIFEKCVSKNIDIRKDWIPVVPVAHYLCGGIMVDMDGRTSINNLFACGECSRTGLHGANRLASNSLLEALVYAHNIFKYHCEQPIKTIKVTIPNWNHLGTEIPKEDPFIEHYMKQLQALMRDYVGIVRNTNRLIKAKGYLELIYRDVEEAYISSKITVMICELRNMINIAHLIIDQSLARKENKGGFYNDDNGKQ